MHPHNQISYKAVHPHFQSPNSSSTLYFKACFSHAEFDYARYKVFRHLQTLFLPHVMFQVVVACHIMSKPNTFLTWKQCSQTIPFWLDLIKLAALANLLSQKDKRFSHFSLVPYFLKWKKTKISKNIKKSVINWESMADSVIQATGTVEFEDGLSIRNHLEAQNEVLPAAVESTSRFLRGQTEFQ